MLARFDDAFRLARRLKQATGRVQMLLRRLPGLLANVEPTQSQMCRGGPAIGLERPPVSGLGFLGVLTQLLCAAQIHQDGRRAIGPARELGESRNRARGVTQDRKADRVDFELLPPGHPLALLQSGGAQDGGAGPVRQIDFLQRIGQTRVSPQ